MSEHDYEKWLAEQEWHSYPDDLPLQRKRKYGPQTEEVARKYGTGDYPLPGTFPKVSRRRTKPPAWIAMIEKGKIYPGAKLKEKVRAERENIVDDFAETGFSDVELGTEILNLDRKTGFNPLFEFQYGVLNMNPWGQVLIFELNDIHHILHWHDIDGYAIDGQFISDNPDEARDKFFLFELVTTSLGHPEHIYPVIDLVTTFAGSPQYVWSNIPPGPPSESTLISMGIK